MRNRREWDESQSPQWKYFLENEKKKKHSPHIIGWYLHKTKHYKRYH